MDKSTDGKSDYQR